MPYSVKGFFEINADMVQILLMFEVLITQGGGGGGGVGWCEDAG